MPPSQDEIGHCDIVEIGEIGDTNVTIFRQGLMFVVKIRTYIFKGIGNCHMVQLISFKIMYLN